MTITSRLQTGGLHVIASLAVVALAAACSSSSSSSAGSSSSSTSSSGSDASFKVCMGTGGVPSLTWTAGQGVVLQDIAKKEGWSSVVLSNNNSAATALTNVQVFVQDHCSAVIQFNGQPTSNPVMAAKLAAANIPTITYDIAQKGWYFVGINNLKAGIEGGQAFGRIIKQKWNCNPDALIASAAPAAGIVDTQRTGGMVTGILDVCPQIPKSKIFTFNGGGQVSTTLPLARSLLAAHPSWNKMAVVGINDSGVVGVLQAAQQLGRFTNAFGWGQDGSLITGTNVNPHLLGSDFYFLEGYAANALPILKEIQAGHAPPVKDNVNGTSPTVQVEPCPVTAAQAATVAGFDARLAKMAEVAPGTTEYTLFCPTK